MLFLRYLTGILCEDIGSYDRKGEQQWAENPHGWTEATKRIEGAVPWLADAAGSGIYALGMETRARGRVLRVD